MGKPSTYLFNLIRENLGLKDEPLSKFLMTGDFLETDIVFGEKNGIDTLLVLSGNASKKTVERVCIEGNVSDIESKPTHV